MTMQGADSVFGIGGHDLEQSFRGVGGLTPALLPVLQRMFADSDQDREAALGKLSGLAAPLEDRHPRCYRRRS